MSLEDLSTRLLLGSSAKNTISKYSKGLDRYAGAMTVIAAALLGLALSSPIGSSKNLFGLEGQITIFTDLLTLFKLGQGSHALGGAAVFVALPILNIATAFDLWYKHQIHDDKFEKFSRRASACGKLWYIQFVATGGLVYLLNNSEEGIVYMPFYYLFISMILQKFVLTRISRMAALIKFVEDDGE